MEAKMEEIVITESGGKFYAKATRESDGVVFEGFSDRKLDAELTLKIYLRRMPLKSPSQTMQDYLDSDNYQKAIKELAQ